MSRPAPDLIAALRAAAARLEAGARPAESVAEPEPHRDAATMSRTFSPS